MLANERTAQPKSDPRARRTRQWLIKAFEELIEEKSLEAITVQDITDRATVNRATFYAHFEDKYDLLDQAFEEAFARALHKNLAPAAGFSATNLMLLIQTICEFLEQLYTHCAPSNRTQLDSRLEQQVKRQLHKVLLGWEMPVGHRAGAREAAELRATVSSWAIYGACLWWSQGARAQSAAGFARQVLPVIMATLDAEAAPKPRGGEKVASAR